VAEDLTASLGNIITAMRLLELETEPARTRSLIALASRATQEQQALIGRVLDVFSSELATFYGREGQADIAEVVRVAIDDAGVFYQEKKVKLICDDAGGPHFPVAGDAGQFQRVMGNLLDNALQQTPPGCSVSVRRQDTANYITISVEDEGPIIPPNVREKLFSRFEPGASRSTASVLRLHFCRLTVENCQGELGCDPREGRGNRFWISLPRLGTAK
jgi:two-component system sensor histidine kinase TctE